MASMRKPSRIVRVVMKPVPYKNFPHEEGNFTVAQGVHDVTINTSSEPKRVWISLEGSGDVPVCIGDVDKINASILPDGFIVHVEINSTERTIKWYVEL
jgi:hypothetical protein